MLQLMSVLVSSTGGGMLYRYLLRDCGQNLQRYQLNSNIFNVINILLQNLLNEWHEEENLSIVIVRHPLSRLASVYYQKFVELSGHKSWSKEGLNTAMPDILLSRQCSDTQYGKC